jgi:hypothetical protein
MIRLDHEYRCVWPNGEDKNVTVTRITNGIAYVIWKEPYDVPNSFLDLDAEVPVAWLSEKI